MYNLPVINISKQLPKGATSYRTYPHIAERLQHVTEH